MSETKIIKIMVGIIISIAVLAGCQEQNSPTSLGNRQSSIGSGTSPDEFFAYSDAILLYDTTNVYGVIDLSETKYDYIDQYNQVVPQIFSGTSAYFWENLNNAVDSLYLPINEISINEYHLVETGHPHNLYAGSAPIYFGTGSNHISIQPNQYIPAFDTNITLLPVLRFTNIHSRDTIYANQEIPLIWTGSSNGFASLIIQQLTTEDLPVGSIIYSISGYIRNDGQFIINAGDLSDFPEGEYMISVGRYEPYFATLSNGKRIAITDASGHTVFVYLKH
ncbi:MAG: hypothetical protein ABFD00_07775 [Chloroherpetonaceae bacterium]|nr:hypothetical protein [bacterium]